MIPAGYVNSIVLWATMPTLGATGIAARKASLVAEFEALATGQLPGTGKTAQSLVSASANGKSFTFDSSLTKPEKLTALTAALRRLGLIDPAFDQPTATYGDFSRIRR